ncbi:MAG TPA: NYN domain-containing protein [Thermoleophilaceae bacterium]|jgi:uncharacterized LabA/DUF88 family protein
MDVGVYIDGYNLYYGARGLCGGSVPGWRWLDLRGLASSLVPPSWSGAAITRLVYCTARIDAAENPTGYAEQDIYLKALQGSGSADWIEYGYYVSRVKKAPLAVEGPQGRPVLTRSNWPVMIRDGADAPVPGASFMVKHARREEKGSDVNVAAHLLLDVLTPNVNAAIVVSNDSDLRFAVKEARPRVPVGTVNPSRNYTAGALKGAPTDGVGGHWWRKLTRGDITSNQLPDPAGGHAKPAGW